MSAVQDRQLVLQAVLMALLQRSGWYTTGATLEHGEATPLLLLPSPLPLLSSCHQLDTDRSKRCAVIGAYLTLFPSSMRLCSRTHSVTSITEHA